MTWYTASPPTASSIELGFKEGEPLVSDLVMHRGRRTIILIIVKDHAHRTVRYDRIARLHAVSRAFEALGR